jgi:hypothetical protein
MCAIMSWGAQEYFMHPFFVLKNGCDIVLIVSFIQKFILFIVLKKILGPARLHSIT